MEKFWLAITGFSAGFIVAGGVVALMTGLGILIRFIGISHTASGIRWYENCILLGTVAGTVVTVFPMHIPVGEWLLLPAGLFMGVFVGGWIMALAEVINVFPVYCRRLRITKGYGWIVVTMALGKTLGSLLLFYKGWGKG